MAFTWPNSGSYKDLTGQLQPDPVTALAPTSQAGGNMMSSNRFAMSAPGSQPVDPLPPSQEQGDPKMAASGPVIRTGTSGKPQASKQTDTTPPGPRPAWGKTTVPDVIRGT